MAYDLFSFRADVPECVSSRCLAMGQGRLVTHVASLHTAVPTHCVRGRTHLEEQTAGPRRLLLGDGLRI